MFGRRYFGGRYFGPRYWGEGGAAPPPSGQVPRASRYRMRYRNRTVIRMFLTFALWGMS